MTQVHVCVTHLVIRVRRVSSSSLKFKRPSAVAWFPRFLLPRVLCLLALLLYSALTSRGRRSSIPPWADSESFDRHLQVDSNHEVGFWHSGHTRTCMYTVIVSILPCTRNPESDIRTHDPSFNISTLEELIKLRRYVLSLSQSHKPTQSLFAVSYPPSDLSVFMPSFEFNASPSQTPGAQRHPTA